MHLFTCTLFDVYDRSAAAIALARFSLDLFVGVFGDVVRWNRLSGRASRLTFGMTFRIAYDDVFTPNVRP